MDSYLTKSQDSSIPAFSCSNNCHIYIIPFNGLTPRQQFTRTASAIYQNRPLSPVCDFDRRNGLFEGKLRLNEYTKLDKEAPRKRDFISYLGDEKLQSHQKALEKTNSIIVKEDPTPIKVILDKTARGSSKQDTHFI